MSNASIPWFGPDRYSLPHAAIALPAGDVVFTLNDRHGRHHACKLELPLLPHNPAALRHAPVAIACCLAGGLLVVASAKGNSLCDPSLNVPQQNPFAYRQHDDRCEGIYVQPVAGTSLVVASFTLLYPEYQLNSGAPLRLSWATPGDGTIHLRAQSTKRRAYYRMDAPRPGGTSEYVWPTNILTGLGLTRANVGIVAWTRLDVGGVSRIVYLPLRVQQDTAQSAASGYRLVLVPGRQLQEVYVTLARLNADGGTAAKILDGQQLSYGYYPAEREIAIALPKLSERGIYQLQLGAVLSGGGSTTTELWFFHPGS